MCVHPHIPYGRKFLLVQSFVKIRPDSSEEIFAVFIFTEQMCDALTTPLPADGYTPHANRRQNNTERRSEEASLCNNGLVFLWRPSQLRKYQECCHG